MSCYVFFIWVFFFLGYLEDFSKLINFLFFFYLGDMNICCWGVDVGLLGFFFYICGGSDDFFRLEIVERFDLYVNVWVLFVFMLLSCNGVGVMVGNGRIYVLGMLCRMFFEFF